MLEYSVEIATSKGVESNFLFHWLWDIVVLVPFRASAILTDACHLKVSCFETETPRTRTWQGVQAEIAGTIIVKSMRGSNCEGIEFILFLAWSDPVARGFLNSTSCFRAVSVAMPGFGTLRFWSRVVGFPVPKAEGHHLSKSTGSRKSLWVKLLYDELPSKKRLKSMKFDHQKRLTKCGYLLTIRGRSNNKEPKGGFISRDAA